MGLRVNVSAARGPGNTRSALGAQARVVTAPEPKHGHLSRIKHGGRGLFRGLPQDFTAVRYHPLCVAEPLPLGLRDIAWSEDGVLMGLRHRARPLWGVRFHPESVLTGYGHRMLGNFRDLTIEHANGESVTSTVPPAATVTLASAEGPRRARTAARTTARRGAAGGAGTAPGSPPTPEKRVPEWTPPPPEARLPAARPMAGGRHRHRDGLHPAVRGGAARVLAGQFARRVRSFHCWRA
ncbi:glutamine amidotransferase-related protein [Streptomyces sp. HNM1019]|uniref:glutamine amidotransferase-related protein n=1 Tax=Streptomyces sp. HNM1019 TaxID=3424717 RepID=UPI003D77EBAD